MADFVNRTELDDLLRHVNQKVDRSLDRGACTLEEVACLSRALKLAIDRIEELAMLVMPLLSTEQCCSIERVERGKQAALRAMRNGVTPAQLLAVMDDVDAEDARRERSPAMKAAAETGVFTSQQIEDLKAIGSFFVVKSDDAGPCYNRDAGDDEEGREHGTLQG